MRIAIIGGIGHIGTYLIPRLVRAGHEIINISRGKSHPYQHNQVWKGVNQVVIDRIRKKRLVNLAKRFFNFIQML